MPLSGYSVAHDFEVQEYNQRRAAWKAAEKQKKQEEKLLREQAKLNRRAASHPSPVLAIGRKHSWSPRGVFSSHKHGSEKSVIEVKLYDGYESDEITLTEALAQ